MWAFSPKEKFSQETVRFTLSGAERAAASEEFTLTATIRNTGDITLKNVECTIRYPEGFQFRAASPKPTNEFSNGWSLGSLAAGKETILRITGALLGERGAERTFSGTVSYEPANFASEFVAESTFTTMLTDSALTVDVNAPHSVITGQSITYDITITNTGNEDLERVRLECDFPDGLTEIATDPKPSEGARQWDFPALKNDDKRTVKVTGTLAGEPKSAHELSIRLGILDSNSAFLVQREKSVLVFILEPTLNIRVTSGGDSTGAPTSAKGSIPVQLTVSNDSDSEFSNATIILAFPGADSSGAVVSLIDGAKVSSETTFRKTEEQRITWTKDEIPALGRLVPGARETINATLPLVSGIRSIGTGMNLSVSVRAEFRAESAGGGSHTATSETLTFPIDTELRLAAEARYYGDEGEVLGSGPLPPSVGVTTTYTMLWYLTNTLNGANDVLLTATLPDAVTFVSAETSGGNAITYDAGTKSVRWRIPNVDARVGQTLPTLVGRFSVSITPSESDVGTVVPLLGETSVAATDAFTGSPLSAKSASLTTDLTNDPLAAGKGTVVASSATNTNVNAGG
jgi:uncharacterized repeat protein (TIGR01451 family)